MEDLFPRLENNLTESIVPIFVSNVIHSFSDPYVLVRGSMCILENNYFVNGLCTPYNRI